MSTGSSRPASYGFATTLLSCGLALAATGCVAPEPPRIPQSHLRRTQRDVEPAVVRGVERPRAEVVDAGGRGGTRVADAGPVRFTIEQVERQGTNLVIRGTVTSKKDTQLILYSSHSAATSSGGDTGLKCTVARLGDNPDAHNPGIAMVAGDAYPFSVTVATHGTSTRELTELRLFVKSGGHNETLSFTRVKED